MNRAFTLRMARPRVSNPKRASFLAAAGCLVLLLSAGLGPASAANLLMNPGFEDGITGWNTAVRGGTATIVNTPGVAHTGNNCVQCYNATGWSSVSQGDTRGGWSSGATLNVDSTKYYKLSAWVKVPGASTAPQAITLRYRFEPSGSRVDVGQKTIDTEDWVYLESGWIKPPDGDTFISYFEVHSVANAVTFLVDDCGLTESGPLELDGKVVDGTGAGVDGATVTAASPGYTSEPASTAGGGFYTLFVPAGQYTVTAGTPGFKGSVTVNVEASPTTAPNIVLTTDPDYDTDLIFSAYSTAIVGNTWPAAYPAGMNLTAIGSPQTAIIDGIQWEKNVDNNHNGPGWRFGSENLGPIAVNGASIVAVIKMGDTRTVSNNWDSVVDVFYDRLVLGVRNDNGLVNVRANGSLVFAPTGTELAEGQKAVLSMVAQLDGTYKVWVNGKEVMTGTAQDPADMSALTPGTETYKHYINVGSNDPDRWTAFNGYIGDVFLYQVALSDAKRQALESKLMTKFAIDPTVYTIEASVATPGGTISPNGTVKVPAGTNKKFTITPDALYEIDKVVVDGVDQGPISTYTFVNVQSSGHTIVAYFRSVPSQIVYGKVTDGTEGVHPAKVYFSLVPGAPANALFTAKTTDLDGNYSVRIPQGTWYAAATATGYASAAEVSFTVAGAPTQQNFVVGKLASVQQPLLTGKGAGVPRTNHTGAVGFRFNTGPNAIDITSLGFVDWEGDGLVTEHRVGIWQTSDHAMVAEVTVPSGTAGTLNGDYRYASLGGTIRLEANTTYVIGAEVTNDPAGDKWPEFAFPAGLGQPDFANITQLAAYWVGDVYGEPTNNAADNQVFAACNLIGKAVPAPTVKGTVKDSFGKPIPNAIVQVGGAGIGAPAYVTDAVGKYRIQGVPVSSSEEIYADAVGYADNTQYIDTSTADVNPVVKDIVLTAKIETGVIRNGGFEEGTAGWSIFNQQAGDVISVVSPGWSGGFAGKFTPGPGNSWTWPRQELAVIPGSVYNAYFKGYTDPSVTEWFPMVTFRNDNEDELKGWISGETGFEGWAHYPPHEWMQYLKFHTYSGDATQPFVRISPPEGATRIDIWPGGVAGTPFGGGSSYFDDIVIDRIGPDEPLGPFTTVDVLECLRWAGGLASFPAGYAARYDVVTNGKVDLADALRIARKVAGLEANP